MTVLSQNDYERFTWKHRKVLLPFGIITVALRISTSYLNLKTGIVINGILTVLAIGGFLVLAELLILKNYEKSIEKMENNNR
ncbi:MAG: hypothetical protein RE471_04870 [Ferroplasma sp.]|uniref:hypothetical protein n=1 Tax=Ferroplasma sp. TaxID=2591003 RepID=UPI002815F760|nr:hypothetical protein [Ferroplasma sp.]WMT52214.1 MAG: hypothetical protein RE471_04870 [Ferroplasma sp.]